MTYVQTRPSAARRTTPTRRGRAALGLGVLLVGTFTAGAFVLRTNTFTPFFSPEQCTATVGGESVTLTPEQAVNASTIAAVATRRGLPARAITIALATAIQESKLENLDGGDRDSAGLFQQRPSQGWGSLAQVTDPVHASARFFDALVKVDGYRTMAVTEAAQAVQRSAFPEAYADHEADARILASALSGSSKAAFTCVVRGPDVGVEAESRTGLTPRAVTVRKELEAAFGSQSLGGFEPGGVSTGHIEESAHYEGRAIDVFFRPYDNPDNKKAGWALAHWLVANADRLTIATVIYDDRIWSAERSEEGWRTFVPTDQSEDPGTAAIERHLDHVHVDVLRGS